jgi:GT2 family glycosyltransferase
MSAAHDITVLITTKDRRDDLRKALRSVFAQDMPAAVLVFDDGSRDGTSAMVSAEFPAAGLVRVEEPLGIIKARNLAMQLCNTNTVITIDDDCVMPSAATVRQTLTDFAHPRIAAVAIPFYNPFHQLPPSRPEGEAEFAVSEFTGCANALNRRVFLSLGGYSEDLWRQTEELDYCTRLLHAGYIVRAGTADPIQHCESPLRSLKTIAHYSLRNRIVYAWRNVPGWRMPVHLLITAVLGVMYVIRSGFPSTAITGLASGLALLVRRPGRSPVSVAAYRVFRKLRHNGPISLSEVSAEMDWSEA